MGWDATVHVAAGDDCSTPTFMLLPYAVSRDNIISIAEKIFTLTTHGEQGNRC